MMDVTKELLRQLEASDNEAFDRKLAHEFGAHPIAALSARTLVEKAVRRAERLEDAIDGELVGTPSLGGPVPQMARYLGAVLASGSSGTEDSVVA